MKKLSLFIGVVLASFYSTSLVAQNPIICDRYTPDPAPYVHGDTLYLFVDHDEDETLNNYFTMKDWLLYSTVDMVNWTYRGTPLTSATFSAWAKQDNDCWASQCIERNAKIVIRTGSKSGTAKGTLTIEPTNGEWVELSCDLDKSITGVQDLFFTMNTPSAKLQFDNWQFFKETSSIRNVNAECPANQNVYDLQGRQTNGANNGHSIHIINGKKVIK